jgi:uncharacterized LabA/DUF88 family protein
MPNTAFIDGQNLYSGIKSLGWTLDTQKFRVRLEQKYGVTRAVYFVGHMPGNQKLYQALKRQGYELAFKPVVASLGHLPKGNVDADLVLRAMIEYPTYDRAVIVSGDGDFYSLVAYLNSMGKLGSVLAPNRAYCSKLLRKAAGSKIEFIEDARALVER